MGEMNYVDRLVDSEFISYISNQYTTGKVFLIHADFSLAKDTIILINKNKICFINNENYIDNNININMPNPKEEGLYDYSHYKVKLDITNEFSIIMKCFFKEYLNETSI